MIVKAAGRPAGCKFIRLEADVEGGIIHALSLGGDFFASPEGGFEKAAARLAGTPVQEVGGAFELLLKEEGVEAFGINGAGIAELLEKAMGIR